MNISNNMLIYIIVLKISFPRIIFFNDFVFLQCANPNIDHMIHNYHYHYHYHYVYLYSIKVWRQTHRKATWALTRRRRRRKGSCGGGSIWKMHAFMSIFEGLRIAGKR